MTTKQTYLLSALIFALALLVAYCAPAYAQVGVPDDLVLGFSCLDVSADGLCQFADEPNMVGMVIYDSAAPDIAAVTNEDGFWSLPTAVTGTLMCNDEPCRYYVLGDLHIVTVLPLRSYLPLIAR